MNEVTTDTPELVQPPFDVSEGETPQEEAPKPEAQPEQPASV